MSEYDALVMDEPVVPSEPVDPKDEFFHSLYISGQERELDGVTEEANKLQVRGVEYNLTEAYFIMTHVKKMQVNETGAGRNSRLSCFSYQFGQRPYKGTDGHVCPETSKDREGDPHCANCRAHVLCAGILTDKNGTPKLDEKKNPIFIFIRGKGIKYAGLSDYLFSLYKMTDLVKISENEDNDRVLNRSKVVTKVTKTKIKTNYGDKFVFKYEVEKNLPQQTVEQILKLSTKTLDKFHEKFDWSKRKKQNHNSDSGVIQFDTNSVPEPDKEEGPNISFDDLEI